MVFALMLSNNTIQTTVVADEQAPEMDWGRQNPEKGNHRSKKNCKHRIIIDTILEVCQKQ